MARIGVVLSGCGFMDGAEIHEATLALLALDRRGEEIVCMAPDVDAIVEVDHASGHPTGDSRNVLKESARIARGEIRDIATVNSDELDALIFPGGFGAAKNLCSWATDGPDCSVNQDVERLIKKMFDKRKPLGFICIAPVLAARVLGEHKIRLTIGNDPATAAGIEARGAKHENTSVEHACIDNDNLIASTPAYMLGPSISHVAKGIDELVEAVSVWASK